MTKADLPTAPGEAGSRIGRVLGALTAGDGRQIRHYTTRLGLGAEIAYPTARTIRFLREPNEYFRRRAAMGDIRRDQRLAGRLDERSGWGTFTADELPGIGSFVTSLNALVDTRRGGGYSESEPFRRTVVGPDDLRGIPRCSTSCSATPSCRRPPTISARCRCCRRSKSGSRRPTAPRRAARISTATTSTCGR